MANTVTNIEKFYNKKTATLIAVITLKVNFIF